MSIFNRNVCILSLTLLLSACSTMKTTSATITKNGNKTVIEKTETSFDSKVIDSFSRILMVLSGKTIIEASLNAIAEQVKPEGERSNRQSKSGCNIQKLDDFLKDC